MGVRESDKSDGVPFGLELKKETEDGTFVSFGCYGRKGRTGPLKFEN